jgi:hypothetical protein
MSVDIFPDPLDHLDVARLTEAPDLSSFAEPPDLSWIMEDLDLAYFAEPPDLPFLTTDQDLALFEEIEDRVRCCGQWPTSL